MGLRFTEGDPTTYSTVLRALPSNEGFITFYFVGFWVAGKPSDMCHIVALSSELGLEADFGNWYVIV